MTYKDPHRYDDLLETERPVSKVHKPMPMSERAAQFSPFAALTDYDAAIRETARLTEERTDLSEERKEELDRIIQYLSTVKDAPVQITWFEEDMYKEGGAYRTSSGILKKADPISGRLVLKDGTSIPSADITEIDSPLLAEMREEEYV